MKLKERLVQPSGLQPITRKRSSPLHSTVLDAATDRMRSVFPIVKTYLGHVPSYPGVLWSWTAGSMTLDPSVPRRSPPAGLRYYTSDVHRAAFALPAYLQPGQPEAALVEGARDAAGSPAIRGPFLG